MDEQQFLLKIRAFVSDLETPDLLHRDFAEGVPIIGAGKAEDQERYLAAVVAKTSIGDKAFVFCTAVDPDVAGIASAEITNESGLNIAHAGMRYDFRPDFFVDMGSAATGEFSGVGALIVPGCMNSPSRVFGPLIIEPKK